MRPLYSSAFALLVVLFIVSCQKQKAEQPKDFSKAEEMFSQNCSSCHGAQMIAFTDRRWKHGSSKDSLILSITNGYTDAGMPSFKALFSPEEIDLLADYIRTGIENRGAFDFEEENLTGLFETESTFDLQLDTVYADGEIPWGMAFLPDGNLLVAEKDGRIFSVSSDKSKTEVTGGPASLEVGQGGLMDIELHPGFNENGLLYFSYTKPKVEGDDTLHTTAVNRYILEGNELKDETEVFEALPYSAKGYHYGSRLEFDKEGFLFVTVGDRGSRDVNPQDLSVYGGKVHRIMEDGNIPESNPFVGQDSIVTSIYSYGHRNPQGLVYDAQNDLIYTHEHGPRGGDELNINQPGKNYGWPVVSYGINYDGTIFTSDTVKAGMESPLHFWVPSIAPCGMDMLYSDKYEGWNGSMLVASLRFKYLDRVELADGKVIKEEPLVKNVGRVRNVKVSPDGYIYIAVEEPGYIFKLVPIDKGV